MAERSSTQMGLTGAEQPAGTAPQPASGAVPARLAFHETMELHELLNFKTVCLVKAKLLSGVVFDQDLKALLEKDAAQSTAAIAELENLYRGGATLQ